MRKTIAAQKFQVRNLKDFKVLYVFSFWFIRQNLGTEVFGYSAFNSSTVTVTQSIKFRYLSNKCSVKNMK